MNGAKIAVGLSGGVDSAVAALLLKRQGYEVVGVHLYCYPAKSEIEKDGLGSDPANSYAVRRAGWIKKNGCRADEDKAAALKTALELDIPFKTLDFSEEYNSRVVDYFYREYVVGRTPNPDVLCNSEIKFGLFLDWAMENGFDFVATGHYARLRPCEFSNSNFQFSSNEISLQIPRDKHKDQTYFLWKVGQDKLKKILFPLSDLLKSQVRQIAKEAGLSVAARPDSQGICFIGNVEARKFLARRLKEKKGEVKNVKGEIIGTHDGVWFFTIGQRGGWSLDPGFQNSETPIFYVISKDAKKNELVVGVGDETERQEFEVGEVIWLGDTVPQCHVRIRHGGKLLRANLQFFPQSGISLRSTNTNLQVYLEEGERGVAPGQSVVFYSSEGVVLGGGVIA